jgi:hypothetical protein
MRRTIRSVLPTTMADTYTLNRRRQICRSALDPSAPNVCTECHCASSGAVSRLLPRPRRGRHLPRSWCAVRRAWPSCPRRSWPSPPRPPLGPLRAPRLRVSPEASTPRGAEGPDRHPPRRARPTNAPRPGRRPRQRNERRTPTALSSKRRRGENDGEIGAQIGRSVSVKCRSGAPFARGRERLLPAVMIHRARLSRW